MPLVKRTLVKGSLAGGAALVVGALAVQSILAHKQVTSPYDYNKDIFPILRDRCGSCHVDGGPAMTLMTYKADNGGASAWAEQMREMLVNEQMLPWSVDLTSPESKADTRSRRGSRQADHPAAGGTPEGDLDKKLRSITRFSGRPVRLTRTGAAGAVYACRGHRHTARDTRLRRGDQLHGDPMGSPGGYPPGTGSRNAVIAVENGPVLAVWVLDNDPIPALSVRRSLPAGAAQRSHPHRSCGGSARH
jgi:hypothetical protein